MTIYYLNGIFFQLPTIISAIYEFTFKIYYNNLCWTLKYYNIIDNELEYIQDLPTCENKDVEDIEDYLVFVIIEIQENENEM